MADALLELAVRWRLHGWSHDEFVMLAAQVAEEAFRPVPAAFFIECNPVEATKLSDRIARAMQIHIDPLLIEELVSDPSRVEGSLVITPYFHLAEVRTNVGDGAAIVPLNVIPSEETMRALSELPRDASVLAIGRDDRTAQQIAGLASHYALTQAVAASLTDPANVDALIDAADVVVITNATGLPAAMRARARRVVVIEFDLETSGLEAVRAAIRSAEAETSAADP